MESDTLSVSSNVSVDLTSVIDEVDACLARFGRTVEGRYLQFRAPEPGSARAGLWTRFGITERLEIEDLEPLLVQLARADRDRPWFAWLQWVFWDYN